MHGGWWKSFYGLEYGGFLCEALRRDGVATWSIEYRRVGDAGGGWPGTFEDIAAGFDFLAALGKSYALDLSRVVVAGHSAGGQLGFWLAGRMHLPETGALASLRKPAVGVKALVGLAGALDLRLTIDLAGYLTFAHDKAEVISFMGGSPSEVPERYKAGNPGDLLPLNVPQYVVQGTEDDQIPPGLPGRWAERGKRMGERVEVTMLAGAGHFDVVDPESSYWAQVRSVFARALA